MKIKLYTVLIVILLFSNYTLSQEKDVKIFSDFQFGGNLKFFSGKNFLSDAHHSVYKGIHLEVNVIEFKNFAVGGIYEKNISEVKKPELAGNFDYISLNHYAGYIGYKYNFKGTNFSFYPKIIIGDIKTKQKASGYYATNNGNYWGINGQINYNISKKLAIFSAIGYNFYTFKVKTTPEYENYFNKSNALNISLGIKF